MVSSICRGSCSTMATIHTTRKLHIDPNKDYKTPLQVETSVEYDLPPHIYPPKGSEPILMIHPDFAPQRPKKVTVSNSPINSVRLIADQQVSNSQHSRSVSKLPHGKNWCTCGNPSCSGGLRVVSVRSGQQIAQPTVLTSRQVHQVQDMILLSSNRTGHSNEQKIQQQKLHQKAQLQKQLQAQQKQLKLQQQQQQLQVTLQSQQLQQMQVQQKESSVNRQQNTDQLLGWGVSRCQGPCCQPRIGALPPPQAEFLAPGLPPSLLARTPTRGTAGGSPKLRARTRRGLSVANTINVPEYLGTTRPSRASSVGGGGISNHVHHRTRSGVSAMSSTPITSHQVASALDVVRGHALTPRSLFTSTHTPTSVHCAINNANSLLSATVGQSRDSGCSIGATDLSMTGSENSYNSGNNNINSSKNVDWSWRVVDSGFCTPVESEDQLMEPLDLNISSNTNLSSGNLLLSTVANTPSIKDANTLNWMRNITSLTPTTPNSGLYNPYLQPKTAHYIPQPIWNLAY